MLNQSFTAENFRKIFDYENRKGVFLEGEFFPEIEKLTIKLRKCAGEFKELKKSKHSISPDEYEKRRIKLNVEKELLKEKKEKLLIKELEKISASLMEGCFDLNLLEAQTDSDKRTYKVEKSATAYFALKQIQSNIRKLYKVKQANRYNIICQLRESLNDDFPKFIIRTDIEEFYESIPRQKLIDKINEEPLLTLSSKKLIKQILYQYSVQSGSTVGIPRGIGISAYLSELFMRSFDNAINSLPRVIFYARYVDDIIIIFSTCPNSDNSTLLDNVDDITTDHGLSLKQSKTEAIELPSTAKNITYLGYDIRFKQGKLELALSQNRFDKYKKRIDLSFEQYQKQAKINKRNAHRLLVKRIRYLTSNTRLLNNKRRAVVGIYFSNSLLSTTGQLKALDTYLTGKIDQLSSDALKERLKQFSFEEGFTQKRFSRFTTSDFTNIVKAWKYA